MFFPFGRRSRQDEGPFPEAWLPLLHDNVLLYRTLSEPEQAQLRDLVRVLVARKNWEGCAGQVIDDEVKVTIAAQAAFLLLGLDGYAFDELQTILVYPGGFLRVLDDELGHPPEVQMVLGEAASRGPVVLSWWHARWGGRRLGSVNVVLHEFAHKLAELGDPEAGRPPLVDPSLASRWNRIMGAARDQLAEDDDYGRPTLLDPYGAESASEFFAVATESFFLRPAALRRRQPDVYELLCACYRQDPAQRSVPAEVAAAAGDSEEEYNRQVVAECTAALKVRPDHAGAYRERAEYRLALGDVEGAIADWTSLLSLVEEEDRAEVLYSRAGVYREAGRLDEALADYSAAIAACPECAVAYAERGAVRAERGERKEALADLNEALRLDPRDDTALIERALLFLEAGKGERARKDLDRAAKLCPHDPAIFRYRAKVHLDGQDLQRALADAEEAVRLEPEDGEGYRVRAEVLEALGRTDEARRDRESAERLQDQRAGG